MGPQEKKFSDWFETQKKNGLVDIKVSLDPDAKVDDREEFFKELNDINEAIAQGKAVPINWKEIEGD